MDGVNVQYIAGREIKRLLEKRFRKIKWGIAQGISSVRNSPNKDTVVIRAEKFQRRVGFGSRYGPPLHEIQIIDAIVKIWVTEAPTPDSEPLGSYHNVLKLSIPLDDPKVFDKVIRALHRHRSRPQRSQEDRADAAPLSQGAHRKVSLCVRSLVPRTHRGRRRAAV